MICPLCKGEKVHKIPSINPIHVYITNEPIVYDLYECDLCHGKGKISNLAFAIYEARRNYDYI